MKKIYIIISMLLIVVTLYNIADSYAKYVTQASGSMEKQAGAWVIKVNDRDISSKTSTKTFTINNLTLLNNEYVIDGKIAPNSVGYFDISIDPTGTSTAIKFDVTLDLSDFENVEAIHFESACLVVNGEENPSGMTRTAKNTYTGIIPLSDVKQNTITTARLYIKWEDSETDIVLGLIKNNQLNLPIEVDVSQYMGEELVEYQDT